MSVVSADRNLLFGLLALQNNFIGRDQLVAAFGVWVADKSRPLSDILFDQKALDAPRRELLLALTQQHLLLHGNDPEKSLAAISSIASAREDLEQLADPQLNATLMHVSVDVPRPQAAHGSRHTPCAVADGTRSVPATKGDAANPPSIADDPYATLPSTVGQVSVPGLRFQILRPHAKGGLGQVSIALDSELHREVALKEIQERHADHPDVRSRFLREAEITGGLEHPGIVPVYGLGTYGDGRPFYAMKFIKGDSLKTAIEAYHRKAAQPQKTAAQIAELNLDLRKLLGRFIDVCNAMQYAHDRGVLHRDLKPGNIMLGKYGETLVVDWGLAKPLGEQETSTSASEERPLIPSSSDSGSAETIPGVVAWSLDRATRPDRRSPGGWARDAQETCGRTRSAGSGDHCC